MEDITIVLQQLKKAGLHRSLSGGMALLNDWAICGCCQRKTKTLFSHESLGGMSKSLCRMCSDELDDLYKK